MTDQATTKPLVSESAVTDEDAVLQSEAPLIEHLSEMRRRLVYSVIALALAFAGCFVIAPEIFNFLVAPLAEAMSDDSERRLIYTALPEKFFTEVKVALYAAFCITFPIIASQLWIFVAPGLYKHEKSAFLPFLIATPFLFAAGAAMAYYVVFPLAWTFFLGFETADFRDFLGFATVESLPIEFEGKVNEYLALVMRLIFAFGLCFELPVVMTLLGRIGLVSSKTLGKKRKYALVAAFVAAAILTPPDPVSQVILALPIIVLYEVSVWCVWFMERDRSDDEFVSDDRVES